MKSRACHCCHRAYPKKRVRSVKKKSIRVYEEGIKKLSGGREICVTRVAWDRRRTELYEKQDGKCARCGAWTYFSGFHAHHRRKRSLNRDDRLPALEGLCETCHAEEHDEFKKIKSQPRFGERK